MSGYVGSSSERVAPRRHELDLSRVRGWVFDVDGCLINTARPGGVGGIPFERAAEVIELLKSQGRPVVCCTNASGKQPAEYAAHLRELGIPIEDEELLTAGLGLVHAVASRHAEGRVLVLGNEAIAGPIKATGAEVIEPGDGLADAVVIAGNSEYTKAEFDTACLSVMAGAPFYVAVMTRWFHGGGQPSASMTSGIAAAIAWITGVEPQVAGKPSELIAELVIERLGVPGDGIAVVGDSIEAEIGLAAVIGGQGIWVRTGAPAPAASEVKHEPHASFADVAGLYEVLVQHIEEERE